MGKSKEVKDARDITYYITAFGRYHIFFFAVCFVPSYIAGIQALHTSFTNALPTTRCCVPELESCDGTHARVFNSSFFYFRESEWFYRKPKQEALYCAYCPRGNTTVNDTCTASASIPCDHGYVFDTSIYKSSAAMDFGLTCGDAWKREMVTTIFMVGLLLSGALSGFFSDRYGRRPTFLFGAAGSMVVFAALPLSPNYPVYLLLMMACGFMGNVTYLTAFVVLMEMMGGVWRTICGLTIQVYFSLAYVWIGTSAMFIKEWHTLYWIASAPTIAYLGYYWLFPESIRWMISKGRKEEAIKSIQRIARINKLSIPDAVLRRGLDDGGDGDGVEQKESVLELFKHWPLAKMTLIVFFTWMVASLTYYGLSLNTGDLPGSVYTNLMLSGVVEIPGYLISIPLLEYWGRRPSIVLMWALGGAGCLAAGLIPTGKGLEGLIVFCAMLGKISVAAAFGVIYNYTSELFPTTIRHTATGLCSLMSRVGSMAAPQIHLLALYGPKWVPIVIYGSFALAAAVLNVFLPETRNRPMPETIADGIRFARGEAPELTKVHTETVPLKETPTKAKY